MKEILENQKVSNPSIFDSSESRDVDVTKRKEFNSFLFSLLLLYTQTIKHARSNDSKMDKHVDIFLYLLVSFKKRMRGGG